MTFTLNPVLSRELKERMRGFRAFLALTFFLGFLTLTAWVAYQATAVDAGFDLTRRSSAGRTLYEYTLTIMTLLVLFLVPGLTAGAVAGERERQTLLPLQVTLLKPRSILFGKVMAALAFIALMIVASLPIFAVAYRLGGVSIWEGLIGIGSVLIVGVLLTIMVLAISTFAKRVQTATLMAYGFTILFCISSFIAYGVASVLDASQDGDPTNPRAVLVTPNPLVFVADAAAGRAGASVNGPIRGLREFVDETYQRNDDWFAKDDFKARLAQENGGFVGGARPKPRAWMMSLMWQVLLAGLLFLLAVRRLRTPAETER